MTTTFFSDALTTSFVGGPTLKIAEAADIVAIATVSGTAPTRVEMLLQIREIGSTTWITVPTAEAGADGIAYDQKPATVEATANVFFKLPGAGPTQLSGYEARITARRVGGAADTTLALAGEIRSNRDSPSIADVVFAAGGNPAYDASTSSLLVTPTRTVADDYDDGILWADVTDQAPGVDYHPSASGAELGRYDHLDLAMTLVAGTVTIETTNDGGVTWLPATPLVIVTNAAGSSQGNLSVTASAKLDMQGWNVDRVRLVADLQGGGTNRLLVNAKMRKA